MYHKSQITVLLRAIDIKLNIKYSWRSQAAKPSETLNIMLPRGIRNNNPLNIRRSKDKWKGLRAVQADAQFCQFETLEYGWRAAFYLLTRTYYHKYRLYTIRSIISKWAPPIENKTDAYIANVSKLTGIDPDEPIGIPSESPGRWMKLGRAMAIQENGTDSIDDFALLTGWDLCREALR